MELSFFPLSSIIYIPIQYTLYIRAGLIFPDFLPGQIPDSGHVYEVYGVNQIILG